MLFCPSCSPILGEEFVPIHSPILWRDKVPADLQSPNIANKPEKIGEKMAIRKNKINIDTEERSDFDNMMNDVENEVEEQQA